MNTHMPGFQSFSGYLHHFVLVKLATSSSIRVKCPVIGKDTKYETIIQYWICRGKSITIMIVKNSDTTCRVYSLIYPDLQRRVSPVIDQVGQSGVQLYHSHTYRIIVE